MDSGRPSLRGDEIEHCAVSREQCGDIVEKLNPKDCSKQKFKAFQICTANLRQDDDGLLQSFGFNFSTINNLCY